MVSVLLPLNNGLSKTDQRVSPEFVHYSPFLSSLSLILFKSHPYSLHLKKDIPFPILLCVLAPHDHVRLTSVIVSVCPFPPPPLQEDRMPGTAAAYLQLEGKAKRIPEYQLTLRC